MQYLFVEQRITKKSYSRLNKSFGSLILHHKINKGIVNV